MISSTLSSNPAGYGGAVIDFGTAELVNSTVSGSSAVQPGGGIYND